MTNRSAAGYHFSKGYAARHCNIVNRFILAQTISLTVALRISVSGLTATDSSTRVGDHSGPASTGLLPGSQETGEESVLLCIISETF